MEQESQDRQNGPDLVASLIRAAGRRIEPPAGAYQQVLTAATAAFREKTAKRRGRTWMLVAAAASVAAVTLLLQWNGTSTQAQIATVARVIGSVEIAVDGGWEPMTGTRGSLGTGARLRTLAGGSVALALDGGASLRLAAATEVQMEGPRRVLLRSGTVYLDNKGSVGTGYQIETPAGTARDVGTQFELHVAGSALRLRVREGRVEVDRAGQLVTGSAGEQLEIDVLGSVVRSTIATTDAAWQWAETLAPAPDIDGKPAAVLLDWVARETGRRLHYESATVQARAATVILHGNIRHLAPLAALDVMLATTDLEYSLVGDTMEVRTRTEL
jgi:ferric-dicitrate binding protein FerR (iron transport regulator)